MLLAVLWSRPLTVFRRAALVAPILFDVAIIAIVATFVLASHGELAEVFAPTFQSFYALAYSGPTRSPIPEEGDR